MPLTRKDIIKSIVRKTKHEPLFDLGREIYDEIIARIGANEEVKVDEIAAKLVQGYNDLLGQHPHLYTERYAHLPITYHPRNRIVAEELKGMAIEKIVDGVDLLLAARNGNFSEIGQVDLSIYARDHNCPYDKGEFNVSVLVTQLGNLRQFHECSKPQEEGKHKQCGAMGRTGYLVKLKQ